MDGYSGGYTYMYSKGGQLEGWPQSLHLFFFSLLYQFHTLWSVSARGQQ